MFKRIDKQDLSFFCFLLFNNAGQKSIKLDFASILARIERGVKQTEDRRARETLGSQANKYQSWPLNG